MDRLVILGAGAPNGDVPAALHRPLQHFDASVVVDTSGCFAGDAIFVAGYQANAIRARFPNLAIVENPEWEQTGNGASLLVAPFHDDNHC